MPHLPTSSLAKGNTTVPSLHDQGLRENAGDIMYWFLLVKVVMDASHQKPLLRWSCVNEKNAN